MTNSNVEHHLGKLLKHIAEIAVCARMYTGYNSSCLDDKNAPFMAMFFTDMLHNLDLLGEAVVNNDVKAVGDAVGSLQSMWKSNNVRIKSCKTKITCPTLFNCEEGVNILEDIKNAFSERAEQVMA